MNRLRLTRRFVPRGLSQTCVAGCALLLCLVALPGCLLLDWSTGWFAGDAAGNFAKMSSSQRPAKIPAPKSAVTLDIVFVERPADDPLLGPALWDEVDQIGSLPGDEGQALADLGFRVGRVGANPPRALQTLMGLATEVVGEDEKRLVGRRVTLPSGVETKIDAGSPRIEATINVPTSEGMERRTFHQVRGVFRVTAKRLQTGWARLEFLPEIHHGRMTNRPTAVRGQWQLQTSQMVERLYGQRFSLDLNLGEMVIITGKAEPKDSLGRNFFYSADFTGAVPKSPEDARKILADMGIVPQSEEEARQLLAEMGIVPKSPEDVQRLLEPPAEASGSIQPGIQRLLIIRLADLSAAKPLYSEN